MILSLPVRKSGIAQQRAPALLLVTLLCRIAIALAATEAPGASQPQQSSSPPAPSSSSYRAVLNRYCVTCHNERLKTAGLTLDTLDLENAEKNAAVWEKVVQKLRTASMPPAGMPRPDPATYNSLAAYLETSLDRAAAASPNPGRPGIHRLNRAEYTNAIRDLLALDMDGSEFLPADDSGEGFDNIADLLSISPVLMERYMTAARRISRLAIGDSTPRLRAQVYQIPPLLLQDARMSEDLPFGSRGGIAIRHDFPLDGEYTIRIRLQRNSRDYIRGLAERHLLDVRLDGERLKLFTIGGEHRGRSGPAFSQAVIIGDQAQEIYESRADENLEVRFPARTGQRVVGITFVNKSGRPEGVFQPRKTQFDLVQYKGGEPAIESVAIRGPYDPKGMGETPSREKIFLCRPKPDADRSAEEQCATRILTRLARLAYRRPVTPDDLKTLLGFYSSGRNEGGFEEGVGAALERMLVGPEFLFRVERTPGNVPPGAAYRISDFELASRLSFFLWSSVPDGQLLNLAARGKLGDREVLQQQLQRMLADSRAKALVTNFAGQWLYLRNLEKALPDVEAYPDFDENLRQAFQQETELFFESMLLEDHSVLDLLNANYTFLNERLARHYGIPNVYGSHFRRVTLNDERRRGLLGQGSILTVTSYANRTSVVLRGKWLLENILGAPPPPPPPNVPSLPERSADGRALPLRQLMEQHRANPVCATCHARIDPLGFALENFDAIGKWRAVSAGTPIDASAVLPDGARFEGPDGLRKTLLSHPQEFAAAVTEKLLTYALGRRVQYNDAPAIRKIVRDAAPGGYRWSSLIGGIVRSTPFQMRRSPEP